MKISALSLVTVGLGVGLVSHSSAALSPDHVRVAEQRKTKAYLKDGVFVGGDAGVSDVVVRDIRRAANPGYERLVIDLEGNQAGIAAPLARPPYYQVAVSPDERRLVFTVYGNSKLGFDPKRVVQSFAKSQLVQTIDLLPRLEPDQWTFALNLKAGVPAEVFELSGPLRVIIDLKSEGMVLPQAGAALGSGPKKTNKVALKTRILKPAKKIAPDSHGVSTHGESESSAEGSAAHSTAVDPMPADSIDKAEGLLQKELEENIPKAPIQQGLDPMPGESASH